MQNNDAKYHVQTSVVEAQEGSRLADTVFNQMRSKVSSLPHLYKDGKRSPYVRSSSDWIGLLDNPGAFTLVLK